jgi:hypothetical protein
MSSGGFVFAGSIPARATLRLWITIEVKTWPKRQR